jgi:hypothetical protein
MLTYNESIDYQYTIKNLRREIEKNRQALDALKEDFDGISLKEAFTADEVRDYIPQIFADEIIMLGLREATARNLFPVVGQSTNDSFTQRYKYKNTRGAQIVRELNEIKTSKHDLKKKTFGFNKVASAALFSWERLMDSPLQDALDEATFATSQVYQTENRLMWDNLTRFSQGSEEQEWSNWIDGPTACEDPYYSAAEAEAIIDALEDAYLSMTTPLTDRSDPASLRWLWSPQVETCLWKYDTYRRYDLKGSTPSQLTGRLENPFGIPRTIIEPGYYRANGALGSEWVPQACDIYLIDTSQAAGIRERVSQRLDNFTRELVQASGTVVWERLCMWTRHPLKYRRISPYQDYADQIADNADIILKVGDED